MRDPRKPRLAILILLSLLPLVLFVVYGWAILNIVGYYDPPHATFTNEGVLVVGFGFAAVFIVLGWGAALVGFQARRKMTRQDEGSKHKVLPRNFT